MLAACMGSKALDVEQRVEPVDDLLQVRLVRHDLRRGRVLWLALP
jgi:hypothetical protein